MPEPVPAFVGRERELATMHAALAQAEAGRSRLLLVTGEPGIGKSALVDAFAAQAGQRGARVVWGVAWEDGGVPAYWPWVQVLRGLAPELGHSVGGRAPLGKLLPDLIDPEAAISSAGEERFALFDAVAAALERASATAPLVVILEDLHAAGHPSALLLQFVAQHTRGAPVLLVATYRGVEARLTPGLGEVVAALEGEGAVLAVPAMSEREVRDLLAPVMPDVSADLLGAIMERTKGNPLFVAQVARLLVQDPPGSTPPSAVPIPAGIRQAVRQRVERLAGPAELTRKALTASAVLGGEVDLGEVAAVLDTPVGGAAGGTGAGGWVGAPRRGGSAGVPVCPRIGTRGDLRRPGVEAASSAAPSSRHRAGRATSQRRRPCPAGAPFSRRGAGGRRRGRGAARHGSRSGGDDGAGVRGGGRLVPARDVRPLPHHR